MKAPQENGACCHKHQSVSDLNTRDPEDGPYVLQSPVSEGGSPRHYGFDEERLVSFALLKASNNAEAPAFQVTFAKDNILTAVKVAAKIRTVKTRDRWCVFQRKQAYAFPCTRCSYGTASSLFLFYGLRATPLQSALWGNSQIWRCQSFRGLFSVLPVLVQELTENSNALKGFVTWKIHEFTLE